MKKYIILLSMFISASSVFAERANRGAFEGITADDIKAGKLVDEKEIQASIKARKESTKKSYSRRNDRQFSSLGVNYFQIGAGADTLENGDSTGIDARIGLNFKFYKDKKWGIDLLIPFEYTYISDSESLQGFGSGKAELDLITFPVYLRPYYNIEVNSNITIKPFLQFGFGGRYSYLEVSGTTPYLSGKVGAGDFSFVWAVGGGVEICLFEDFYIQGKYLYNASSANGYSIDYYITPEHELSAEIGYRFTKLLAFIVQYSHITWKDKTGANIDLDQDKIGACLRFTF